jgi:ribosomal-protein-alanine N-acetyltransferase
MGVGDLLEVERIDREAFRTAWTAAALASEFGRGAARGWCWVATQPGTLVGYLLAFRVLEEIHVVRMAVRPEAQRRRVGSALVARLIEEADRAAIESIWLEVRVGNRAAGALYESHGFAEVGIRKKYYTDEYGSEDARVLIRVTRT